MTDPTDEEARDFFEALPSEARKSLEDLVRDALNREAEAQGAHPEEAVTEAEIEGYCVEACRKKLGHQTAVLREFYTDEDTERYVSEELERLGRRCPEGVPEGVLADAVYERFRREHPEAWRGRRRRGS